MELITPVILGHESKEKNWGGEGYVTAPGYAGQTEVGQAQGRYTFRVRLSGDELEAVLNGADIMLTVLTFGRPLQPFLVWTAQDKAGLLEEPETVGYTG